MKIRTIQFILVSSIFLGLINAEPIVIKGEILKGVCGQPIKNLRMCNSHGEPIPFQIDEVTSAGNYICNSGDNANSDSSNGIFDKQDEITFLMDDCSEIDSIQLTSHLPEKFYYPIKIRSQQIVKEVYISNDPKLQLSSKAYIYYDHNKQIVKTPFFYAQFGKDRFHFISAGVFNPDSGKYCNFTKELAIKIYLRALWGLIPITFTEDNLVCLVTRYKVGPIRLIRGGNFHLNLGLGLKGSHAFVHQICYPQLVQVPVKVHVPIRFGNFFSDVYIEMSPVVITNPDFQYKIPSIGFSEVLQNKRTTDSILLANPNDQFSTVSNGKIGYGWILHSDISKAYLKGSGFIFRIPSKRDQNSIDFGYRLTIRDLPKGYYNICNWILFTNESYNYLTESLWRTQNPSEILTPWGRIQNEIAILTNQE